MPPGSITNGNYRHFLEQKTDEPNGLSDKENNVGDVSHSDRQEEPKQLTLYSVCRRG